MLGPDVWRENFPAEFQSFRPHLPDAETGNSQTGSELETGNESETETPTAGMPFLPSPPPATAMDDEPVYEEEEVPNDDSSNGPGTLYFELF